MLNRILSYCLGVWNVLRLAIALGGASFAIQGRQGINLADEGFLGTALNKPRAAKYHCEIFNRTTRRGIIGVPWEYFSLAKRS